MMLRKLQASDAAALHALCAAAGWPHREQDCALFLSLGTGLAACAPDGAIIGAAMQWRWSASCATVGMVLVAQARQGKGLGRRLMTELLNTHPAPALMLNATEAGLGLYERLGFRPLGLVSQHQGTTPSSWSAKADHPRHRCRADGSDGPSAFAEDDGSVARQARTADLPDLVALDSAAFGTSRTSLIERLLSDSEIRVLERDGKLHGFACRRPFGRGDAIGPLVAQTEHDAITLTAALLRPGVQRIDIPAEATALAAWLTQAGLVAVDSVTVMTRGHWPEHDSGARRFALATQAFG